MARMKLEIEGFDHIIRRITELEGNAKKVTEKALRETHSIVTAKAEKAMGNSYLPAGGDYSKGDTLRSLRRNAEIEWHGDIAQVPVGFDIDHNGLTSIFLMYGTPRMEPDRELYNAFYGNKTKQEVIQAQENAFYDEIRRLEG